MNFFWRIALKASVRQPKLAQRFMLTSLIILLAGVAEIDIWIGNEIKNGVAHRTGTTTSKITA